MGIEEISTQDIKLKPMKCEFNFLSKSDGSAILSQGDTVALVSVNGPLDIKMQNQSIEKATLEVIYSNKSGKPSVADRYKENIIKQTCETAILGCLYPRTGITVTIQELEDFGGLLACSINCTCLALLNSGVSMRYVYACVTCAVDADGNIVVDPTPEQLASAAATANFVFDSRDYSIVTSFTEGSLTEGAQAEALAKSRVAVDTIFAFYRDIARKYANVI